MWWWVHAVDSTYGVADCCVLLPTFDQCVWQPVGRGLGVMLLDIPVLVFSSGIVSFLDERSTKAILVLLPRDEGPRSVLLQNHLAFLRREYFYQDLQDLCHTQALPQFLGKGLVTVRSSFSR